MITSSPTDPPGNIDVSMIGAGIIGLAIAKSLAEKGQTVTALEQEKCYGSGDSSRNSEVVHAAIYYPQHSLKARLCVEGKHQLSDFCKKYKLPRHR